MKGPKKVETNYLTQIYRERAYRLHVQKLNDISDGRFLKNKYLADNHTDYNTVLLNNKQKAKQRNESAKLIGIQRENSLILKRLMKISNRDPSLNLVPQKRTLITEKTHNTDTSRILRSNSAGFFNFSNKNAVETKMKAKKLAKENFDLAERMIFQKSEIAKWKMDKEYTKFKQIGDRLKRIEVKEGDDSQGKLFKKGEVEYGRDGRIVSKSRMLPPMPKPQYHKKFMQTWRSNSGMMNSMNTNSVMDPNKSQKHSRYGPNENSSAMDIEFLQKLDEMMVNQERDTQSVSSMRYTHRGFEYRGLNDSDRKLRAMSTDRGFYPKDNSERAKGIFELYKDGNVFSSRRASEDDLNVFITSSNLKDRDDSSNMTGLVDRYYNPRQEDEERLEKSHDSVQYSKANQSHQEIVHARNKTNNHSYEKEEESQPKKVHNTSENEIKGHQSGAESHDKEEKSVDKEPSEHNKQKESSEQNEEKDLTDQKESSEQYEQNREESYYNNQQEEQEKEEKASTDKEELGGKKPSKDQNQESEYKSQQESKEQFEKEDDYDEKELSHQNIEAGEESYHSENDQEQDNKAQYDKEELNTKKEQEHEHINQTDPKTEEDQSQNDIQHHEKEATNKLEKSAEPEHYDEEFDEIEDSQE